MIKEIEYKLHHDFPIIFLIVANLFPLLGVLTLGYDAGVVLLIYWTECCIVGMYHLFKIWLALDRNNNAALQKLALTGLYLLNYGVFLAAYLGIIIFMFKSDLMTNFWNEISSISFAILFLLLSHGISFFVNYIARDEFEKEKSNLLIGSSYSRVLIMNVIFLVGAFLTFLYGDNILLLSSFILLKIIFDIRAYFLERQKFGSEEIIIVT
jgi:hypothetical protein